MKLTKYLFLLCAAAFAFNGFAQQSYNFVGIAYDNVTNNNSKFTTQQNTALKGLYLNLPNGIAIDTNGRTYFTQQHRVMIIDGANARGRAGGAGNPTFSSGHNDLNGIGGRFTDPRGIAIDPNTNEVYVCDFFNHMIRKISGFVNASNTQLLSSYAGTYTGGDNSGSTDGALASAKFNGPNDIVVMNNGDIYISEEDNNTIRKISGNMVSTVAGSASALGDVDDVGTAARFTYPRGLCIEDQNNILIADYNNGKIKRLNLTTKAVTTVVDGLIGPQDVAIVGSTLYITEKTKIIKYSAGTKTTFAGSGFTADTTAGALSATRFTDLRKIVYNAKEAALYVVDYQYGIVKKIDLFDDPVVDFTATPTNSTVNQVVSIVDQTTNRKGTRQWTISPNTYNLVNSTTLTSETLKVEFTQTGSYNIKLVYTYPGGTKENEKIGYINVSNVNAAPVANFEASTVESKADRDITLTDLSSNTPTSWAWTITPSAGVTFKSATTSSSKFPIVSFANEGKYTVKLTATNSNGSDDETKTEYIHIDNSFSSIETIKAQDITIYPNPTNGLITILSSANIVNYKIFNLNGQQVASGSVSNNQIDISNLETGAYAVIFEDVNNTSYQTRLIKK